MRIAAAVTYTRGTVVDAASVRSNILMCDAAGVSTGFREADANGDPAAFQSNDLWNCDVAYVNDDGGCALGNLCTVAEIPGGTGNVSVDPLLASLAGADGVVATLADADWSLTASSPASVRTGGADLSGTVDVDFAGAARSAPFSIGAYERN